MFEFTIEDTVFILIYD